MLPPFFKYARRIDKEGVIEFIHKRLLTIDEYNNGFVGNMFRSILETEVNLKEKIVDDFLDNLKPNPLDYSLSTHTMKLKTDYLLLVRKLYGYLEHRGELNLGKEEEKQSLEKVPSTQKRDFKPKEIRRCSLTVSIEGANNVKNPCAENNPPNTYVCFRNVFETEEKELRTPVVYRTTFPAWAYQYELKAIPISQLCTILLNNELEFEVFHKKMPTDGQYANLGQESILIGKAFIDGSSLVKRKDRMQTTGYYHIFQNDQDKHLDDYEETKLITQGQLKVTLTVDKPLVSEFELQDTEQHQHEVILQHMLETTPDFRAEQSEEINEDETILQRALRRAKELRTKYKKEESKSTGNVIRKISKSPQRDLPHEEGPDRSIQELRVKNRQNFKDLESLTTKLKFSLAGSEEEGYQGLIKNTVIPPSIKESDIQEEPVQEDDLDEDEQPHPERDDFEGTMNADDLERATDQNITKSLEEEKENQ